MQKKLSLEEYKNLTVEKAFEIVQDYANLFAEKKVGYLEFDDKLPWPADVILLAALELFKYTRKNKLTANDDVFLEKLNLLLVNLFNFIPSPEKYKEILEIKEIADARIKN